MLKLNVHLFNFNILHHIVYNSEPRKRVRKIKTFYGHSK